MKPAYNDDCLGNREINASFTSASVNRAQFTVDPTTNRLGVPAGFSGVMQYDHAGHLTFDTYTGMGGGGGRSYDAEGRMTTAWAGGFQQVYTYDAAGKRTRRTVYGTTTWQVYGFGGELIAEYAAGAAPSSPQKEYGYRRGELLVTAESNGAVNWLVSDHLGTPRMVADKTGSLSGIKRHDYLPFGEELGAGVGGRTPEMGYTASDGVRQKFTGYEADAETGLNFAQARYQSPTQGRFTGADPYLIIFEMKRGRDAEEQQEMLLEYLMQPQNWAKYTYALNNPLKHIDPTGMRPPTKNEQDALNRLDQLAAQEGDTDLGNGLRAARAEIAKAIDALGKGQQDVGINVAVNAILNIGNTEYNNSSTVAIRTSTGTVVIGGPSNKCNVLVGSAYARGAGLGFIPNGQQGRGYPLIGGKLPAANWLGDSRDVQRITNLGIVTDGSLKAGDIIAWRNNDANQSGHSAIYIGGNVLVYAGSGRGTPKAQTFSYVDSTFRPTLWFDTHAAPVTRRYNGKP